MTYLYKHLTLQFYQTIIWHYTRRMSFYKKKNHTHRTYIYILIQIIQALKFNCSMLHNPKHILHVNKKKITIQNKRDLKQLK